MKERIEDMCITMMIGIFPAILMIEIFGIKVSLILIAIAIVLFSVFYAIIYLICRCIYQYAKALKGNDIILNFRNPIVIKWRAPIVIKQIK